MNGTLLRNTILCGGLAIASVMLGSFYSIVHDSVERSGSFRSHAFAQSSTQR